MTKRQKNIDSEKSPRPFKSYTKYNGGAKIKSSDAIIAAFRENNLFIKRKSVVNEAIEKSKEVNFSVMPDSPNSKKKGIVNRL